MVHQKPAWFEREQPRDWNRGRIEIERDRMTWPARILVIAIMATVAWGIVALIFCISNN